MSEGVCYRCPRISQRHKVMFVPKMESGCAMRLSSRWKSTFSFDDERAIALFCRTSADNRERARAERKSTRTVNAHTHADRDAGCLLATNPRRLKTFATRGVEQRLRVSAGRASGGQHRPALDRLGAGRQSG